MNDTIKQESENGLDEVKDDHFVSFNARNK